MSTSIDAHQLSTLLRVNSALDIVGEVTATVANPSELAAWGPSLPEPTICARPAEDSGNRYVHFIAACHRTPVHGRVTAVLTGDDHRLFWAVLLPDNDLSAGEEQLLPLDALVTAWSLTARAPSIENTPPPGGRPRWTVRDAR